MSKNISIDFSIILKHKYRIPQMILQFLLRNMPVYRCKQHFILTVKQRELLRKLSWITFTSYLRISIPDEHKRIIRRPKRIKGLYSVYKDATDWAFSACMSTPRQALVRKAQETVRTGTQKNIHALNKERDK